MAVRLPGVFAGRFGNKGSSRGVGLSADLVERILKSDPGEHCALDSGWVEGNTLERDGVSQFFRRLGICASVLQHRAELADAGTAFLCRQPLDYVAENGCRSLRNRTASPLPADGFHLAVVEVQPKGYLVSATAIEAVHFSGSVRLQTEAVSLLRMLNQQFLIQAIEIGNRHDSILGGYCSARLRVPVPRTGSPEPETYLWC